MSISDMIVVMKLGVVQQIGAPQEVYDNPTNLFVAKFLGTPPINVFKGEVKDGMLYLGEAVSNDETEAKEFVEEQEAPLGQAVLEVPGVADCKVTVGIRPEAFIVDPEGPMVCDLQNVEVMGRDVSVVSTHFASLNPTVRSIVGSDCVINAAAKEIRYSLKPYKVHLFDAETDERIYFEV